MGNVYEVNRIWKKTKDGFRKMNDEEYICMISSLVNLGNFTGVENLYREWESVSGTNVVRVSNLLLTSYVGQGQMEMVANFCNQLVEKGVRLSYTTWELLTRGYLKKSNVKNFCIIFRKPYLV
ncbi:unnamed protein product [Lathyrus sativus]|nr:unnamed protein product [Lathyrus sativus]